MTTTQRITTSDGTEVRPGRQTLTGALLLVVGCVLAVVILRAELNVLASIGMVIALAGLVLVVNGLLLARRGRSEVPERNDASFDTTAVVALVLAVLVPPVGLLIGASRPVTGRPGQGLLTVAVVVGALLTVLYTFFGVLGAGQAAGAA